jgi:hypothetical protein
MSVTVEQFQQYVGTNEDSDFLTGCLTSGATLVANFIGEADVPTEIVDQAVLLAASELFHRRSAPNGVAQFATMDGSSPIRVARDPMVAVYPLLQPFQAGGGFAV